AFGGAFAAMDLFAAQAAFGKDRKLDRIDVAATDPAQLDALKDRIGKALGGVYDVEKPERRGSSVQQMLVSFQMALNLGSAVAMLVGIFLVYNTVSISVLQRRREIGTLRALGTSGRHVRALFALEALGMGLVGTAIGAPFGWLVAQAAIRISTESISSLYVHIRATEIALTPFDVAIGAALGLAGSVIAALKPASEAARVQPVEALRRDVAAGAGPVRLRSLPVALGVLALLLIFPANLLPNPMENFSTGGFLGMFFVLFGATLLSPLLLKWSRLVFARPAGAVAGIAGRLAADNFSRSPTRSAVPVSALAIGVAMTVCIGGFVGSFKGAADRWIQQSIPADVFITASYKLAGVRNTPIGPHLGPELEKLDGVKLVDRVRAVHVDYEGLYVYILSLEPSAYFSRSTPDFLSGDPKRAREAMEAGGVLVSENLSKRRNLKAGDVLELKTPTGVQRYPVAGVVIDYTSDQGTIAMARDTYSAHFQDDLVDTYELYLEPGADLEKVRSEVLARWGKQYDLFALSNAELRQESEKLLDEAFSITYAMELVAVLLALLGVINTLLAAVLDRTRELGLLRAVGATRGQLMVTIAAEAGLIGIAGGLIGVVAGSAMAWIITDNVGELATGWTIPLLFPWKLATQITFAAMASAVLAGLYPAWRAAKLDVVEALAYE
ncbi:MAG: ABC transporter permease, partial [Myxococcales bacterium]